MIYTSSFRTAYGEGSGMGLRPLNNVIQVMFNGVSFPADEVFEHTFTLIASSCLRVKVNLEKLKINSNKITKKDQKYPIFLKQFFTNF